MCKPLMPTLPTLCNYEKSRMYHVTNWKQIANTPAGFVLALKVNRELILMVNSLYWILTCAKLRH